jgi:hypothetical protein
VSTEISSIDDPQKAEPSILDNEAGRKIDLRDVQSKKAFFLISRSFDPASNVRDARLLIEQRAPLEITVIDAGRKSDFSISHPENTQYSILSSSEGDSKTIEDSAKQSWKQFAPSKRTVRGIQIDSSEEQSENDLSRISTSRDPDSNVNDESDWH